MSGEVIAFLLMLGASVSLAGGIAAAASLVFYVSAEKSPRHQHRETRLPGILCSIDWILLLMLAPAMITGAALAARAAPYIDTSVLALLFILFTSVSAWRVIVNSLLTSQRAAPPNSKHSRPPWMAHLRSAVRRRSSRLSRPRPSMIIMPVMATPFRFGRRP